MDVVGPQRHLRFEVGKAGAEFVDHLAVQGRHRRHASPALGIDMGWKGRVGGVEVERQMGNFGGCWTAHEASVLVVLAKLAAELPTGR